MTDAFYAADGDTFVPTTWTRGPWRPDAQHAGPPAALMGYAAESLDDDPSWTTSRVSVDILRPIPLQPLHVQARIVRDGRRTQLIESVMRSDDVELARASIWRIRGGEGPEASDPLPHPQPDHVPGTTMVTKEWPGWDPSYFAALEWRYVRGSLFASGPAAVWMRLRVRLIEGKPVTPLTRVLVAADSGNGVSSVVSLRTHLFINVELSVHLIREVRGEWVCLDAQTATTDGVGVATSRLWDAHGLIGVGAQSLLVTKR